MRVRSVAILLFVIADIVVCEIGNETIKSKNQISNDVKKGSIFIWRDTRRNSKKKEKLKDRSTSSSSGEKYNRIKSKSKDTGESLEISSSDITTSSSSSKEKEGKKKKWKLLEPKSSADRPGWRKWHRKCPPCPEESAKKWRDPTIKWICGAYQRARRSFKSVCMMEFRNCQDGTMFTKIKDHKCDNDTRHGTHFLYDYKVQLTDESSETDFDSSSDTSESKSSSGTSS